MKDNYLMIKSDYTIFNKRAHVEKLRVPIIICNRRVPNQWNL